MPVLVTGAAGRVGRALCERLVSDGAQVRAYVRAPDAALKAAGAFLAVGDVCEVQRVEAALTGAHTLVHLVGGHRPPRGVTVDHLNRETTECAVIAARAADVQRFVFLSCVGASLESRDKHLRAKAAAEAHVRDGGIPEHVIVRTGPILGATDLAKVIDALVAADVRDEVVSGTIEL